MIIRQRYVKESVVKNKENVSCLFQNLGDSDDKEGSRSGKPSEGTDAELTALGVGDGRKTWIQLSRGGDIFQGNRLNKTEPLENLQLRDFYENEFSCEKLGLFPLSV